MGQLEKKLNFIEKEITELKLIFMQQNIPKTKISLKGCLKNLRIGESKIEEAKRSMFKSGA